ncbi:MAG TPA: hypothetical protein VGH74_17370 [Planctomycetaceae bacterium]
MSVGPELAAEAAKIVSQQNWFKTMTFGQAVASLLIVAGLAGCYHAVTKALPDHTAAVKATLQELDERHIAASQAAAVNCAEERKASETRAAEERQLWRSQIEKQWATVERLMDHLAPRVKAAAALPEPGAPGT